MIQEAAWHKIKWILGILIVCLGVLHTVRLNVIEIQKGNTMPQTIEASKLRNVTYFTDFSLETMEGGSFGSADLPDYTVTVFNVWEPYCSSCLAEMPELDELAQELKDRGIRLVIVNGDAYESPEDVELSISQIRQMNIRMTSLLADEQFTKEVRPILNDAFPGTFVVDSQGNILDFAAGSKSKDAWREYLLQFCGETDQ